MDELSLIIIPVASKKEIKKAALEIDSEYMFLEEKLGRASIVIPGKNKWIKKN